MLMYRPAATTSFQFLSHMWLQHKLLKSPRHDGAELRRRWLSVDGEVVAVGLLQASFWRHFQLFFLRKLRELSIWIRYFKPNQVVLVAQPNQSRITDRNRKFNLNKHKETFSFNTSQRYSAIIHSALMQSVCFCVEDPLENVKTVHLEGRFIRFQTLCRVLIEAASSQTIKRTHRSSFCFFCWLSAGDPLAAVSHRLTWNKDWMLQIPCSDGFCFLFLFFAH